MKVELEHLVKRFGGENVIDDVSFSVETSALALIGSSGGGKSTLLRMLGGLLPATSGSIRMDGRLVPKTERECIAFRRTLGYVFQQGNLFQHLSAQENIALVLREVHGWTKEAADARAFELLGISVLPNMPISTPPNSPADSSSVLRSPVRWLRGRSCCCSMNPPLHWTPSTRRKCSISPHSCAVKGSNL